MTHATVDKIKEAAAASEDIAVDIGRLADAADALLNSRLTHRAIVLLIREKSGVKQADISSVLDALPRLRTFLKEDETT